jgi:hypothetical protein
MFHSVKLSPVSPEAEASGSDLPSPPAPAESLGILANQSPLLRAAGQQGSGNVADVEKSGPPGRSAAAYENGRALRFRRPLQAPGRLLHGDTFRWSACSRRRHESRCSGSGSWPGSCCDKQRASSSGRCSNCRPAAPEAPGVYPETPLDSEDTRSSLFSQPPS